MSRQQLPPQIKKIEVLDRKTAKTGVKYQLRVDGGVNPQTGQRQQVKRRFDTEKAARAALAEIGDHATKGTFVARKAVTVDALCEDWIASLHNARATTINGYAYCLAVESEPKTQSSRRTLPLDEGLVNALRRASARYAQEKLALGAATATRGMSHATKPASRTRRGL
jgi:hypothetical protein